MTKTRAWVLLSLVVLSAAASPTAVALEREMPVPDQAGTCVGALCIPPIRDLLHALRLRCEGVVAMLC